MAKRALVVGINEYRVKPLRGCVNDAEAWADLLAARYDFPRSSIQLLTDRAATKANMIAGLKQLLAGARAGDVLVFTNSSHGSQVADRDGDETAWDEVLCPVDVEEEVVRDDELRELFGGVPEGVRLAAVLDNCHSGTATRAPGEATYPADYDRRERYLEPDFVLTNARGDGGPRRKKKRKERYPESKMIEVLVAGCRDDESSYDARFGNRFEGALTHYALQAIREASYRLTYRDLHERIDALFRASSFRADQHPQLEGSDRNKDRQIFT